MGFQLSTRPAHRDREIVSEGSEGSVSLDSLPVHHRTNLHSHLHLHHGECSVNNWPNLHVFSVEGSHSTIYLLISFTDSIIQQQTIYKQHCPLTLNRLSNSFECES